MLLPGSFKQGLPIPERLHGAYGQLPNFAGILVNWYRLLIAIIPEK